MKRMVTKKPPVPNLGASQPSQGGDSVVLERKTQKIKPPRMHRVLMLNDDFTPMEFVVIVLQEYFNKDREAATQIMLRIHLEGRGICGVFPKDIAVTKVDKVLEAAKKAGHPLQCVSEPVDS
jgi:ATP-dependent Clp protease adaptor protein ClpS